MATRLTAAHDEGIRKASGFSNLEEQVEPIGENSQVHGLQGDIVVIPCNKSLKLSSLRCQDTFFKG